MIDTAPLNPTQIQQQLSALCPDHSLTLHCLGDVGSTNTYLKELASQGAPEGTVVTAEQQTAGRGRRGRNFHSPKGTGIYCSLLLRPQCTPEAVQRLTPWTAVALCKAIQACCDVAPQIKWPNDLLLEGKKLCGILTELELSPQGEVDAVILGFGINVNQEASHFPPDLQPIATSLAMVTAKPQDRNQLFAQSLAQLSAIMKAFPNHGGQYLDHYRALCPVDIPLLVLEGNHHYPATARHIDEHFHLVVENQAGQLCTLSSGEVSIRGRGDFNSRFC